MVTRRGGYSRIMEQMIFSIITAIMAVSREIRGWLEFRKREKEEDENLPPFLTILSSGTTFYTS